MECWERYNDLSIYIYTYIIIMYNLNSLVEYNYQCIIDNCNKKAYVLNKYCNVHWCLDGHSTTQTKYKGYCKNCFDYIIKNDQKKYLNLVNQKY